MEDLAMTITKFSDSMFPKTPSFFDRFFEGDMMDWNTRNFVGSNSTLPAVNVKENDDEFMLDLAAPGMKKNDFKINYDNGRLTISSEISNENIEKEGERTTLQEFNYRSFQRSFNVQENIVDPDKIKARYEDGILHVTLPKRDEVKPKPSREIKIS